MTQTHQKYLKQKPIQSKRSGGCFEGAHTTLKQLPHYNTVDKQNKAIQKIRQIKPVKVAITIRRMTNMVLIPRKP